MAFAMADKMKTMVAQKGILGQLRKLKQATGDDTEKAGKLIGDKIKMRQLSLAKDVMQDISGKPKTHLFSPI
jgi:hypothetical protein